ncbi:hypothetical protein [Clostridium botulinum]|uniref:Uncharacterized protein n=2 Tax=Clostridium botulinum TaxID=1491 RepID=A7GD23_CLOBL|nr:hypothetical protein [Clostridium botulinum]ABS41633.1 hypothetical protein CLI_1418 [Clostridium botulinum F str. Langeland]ACA46377.1 hypothetical protein CLD_3234 [Clostridium botulinum B1 str. Okra]ADF99135.1 hypothetical protein CBF_1393 [Clostridium botulinum F str. 230613]
MEDNILNLNIKPINNIIDLKCYINSEQRERITKKLKNRKIN